MATRSYARSLLAKLSSTAASPRLPSSYLVRHRSISTAAGLFNFSNRAPTATTGLLRGYSSLPTTSSLQDNKPNWVTRPETILLDGCDFEHWRVLLEKPEGEPTRDEIIDTYIKTLAQIVGSEEEARMKIYSVSTRFYFAFGCLISEELTYKLKELPKVQWVLPDSYLYGRKEYRGEPFINGQAVPYDPKYHEEWIRPNERNRPRKSARPKNFERRREIMEKRDFNRTGPPNPAPNMGGMPPQNNMGGMPPQNNMTGPPQGNMGGWAPPPNNMEGPPPPNNMGRMPPPNNAWSPPPNNMDGNAPPHFQNNGGMPPSGGDNGQNQNSYAPDMPGGGDPHQR